MPTVSINVMEASKVKFNDALRLPNQTAKTKLIHPFSHEIVRRTKVGIATGRMLSALFVFLATVWRGERHFKDSAHNAKRIFFLLLISERLNHKISSYLA
ncbi:hypothetical protein PRIPAC_95914 [Pristionchus pacificus]|uniref:Uncharacterized protein n=1 Tax=Pristionchus pacificus TaxID=54126 RepID=A0A2A6CUT8_PRIPA|nr:hypothetical protein PRIPAC_95914 [Pristionchus pacificus]|eukprot:PDM81888.1 hypothetical protein PRIPAC_34042 [Pristionchus pacificus]